MPTHLALGSSVGLADEELSWLNGWQDAPPALFDATDRLVLRYTDELTRTVTVSDALWQELAARFSTTELFELCFTIGLAGLVNRVHATFHTDVDERTSARVERLNLPDDMLPEARQ